MKNIKYILLALTLCFYGANAIEAQNLTPNYIQTQLTTQEPKIPIKKNAQNLSKDMPSTESNVNLNPTNSESTNTMNLANIKGLLYIILFASIAFLFMLILTIYKKTKSQKIPEGENVIFTQDIDAKHKLVILESNNICYVVILSDHGNMLLIDKYNLGDRKVKNKFSNAHKTENLIQMEIEDLEFQEILRSKEERIKKLQDENKLH